MRQRWIYEGGEVVAYIVDDVVQYDHRGRQEKGESAAVMPDIEPYQHQVTGEMVSSRSQHRALLKRHNLVEIGNEVKEIMKPRDLVVDPKMKESRREALAAMADKYRRELSR